MRGARARRERRPDHKAYVAEREFAASRPAEYTHPINPGPGRSDQRRMHSGWRASVALAARLRDKWAGSRGKPTPAEPIREAINRVSTRGQDFRLLDDGRRLMPEGPRRNRWKKWGAHGGLLIDKPEDQK